MGPAKSASQRCSSSRVAGRLGVFGGPLGEAALLAGGADINQANPGDGTTPLLMALINGHFDLAKYFIEHGADPNLASKAGAMPLYAVLAALPAAALAQQPRALPAPDATFEEPFSQVTGTP